VENEPLRELKKHINVMKKLRGEPIPQWLQSEDPLALNNRLLSYCGLLPPNTVTMKRVNMTICTIIIILTLTMVTGALIKVHLSQSNFMAIIETCTTCISQLKCLIKFSVMLIYRKDLRYVINNLKENFYVHKDIFKNEIIGKIKFGKRVAWWITVPYTSLFIGTFALIVVQKISSLHSEQKSSVASNGTNITETFQRTLLLKIWLPVEEEKSPSYEIGFLYQVVCFSLEIFYTSIIDTFLLVLTMFAAIQYELLGMTIQLPADSVAMRLGINTAPSQGKWDTKVIFTR
jgi:7tm Odorant receptor.